MRATLHPRTVARAPPSPKPAHSTSLTSFCPRHVKSKGHRRPVAAFGDDDSGLGESAQQPVRLFSNLDADLRHEPGNVWSAAALVSGTAVGAGILALPAVTAPAGFGPSVTALTAAALFSAVTGLLVAEVSVNTLCELGTGRGVSLGSMARRTLGEGGAVAVSVTYALLHYSLLVAYISRAGETIATTTGASPIAADVLFTGALGALCFFTRPKTLDVANNVLVGAVLATFLALLVGTAGQFDASALLTVNWGALRGGPLPVIALAFVFQNCVPIISSSLEGDLPKIRTAILAGVALPWAMFVAWDAAILGSSSAGAADPLVGLRTAGPTMAALVDAFSLLAITTSFIGFVLGLSEFVAEALPYREKTLPYALTLLPPLAFAIFYPDIFFSALEYAGTYGVLVLFGLVPAAMAWSERYWGTTLSRSELVPGGWPVLMAVAAAAGGVILDQLLAAGHA